MLYLEDTESDPECDGMLSHTLPSLLWFVTVAIVSGSCIQFSYY